MGGRARAVDPTQVQARRRDHEDSRQGNLPHHKRHRRGRGMVQADAVDGEHADGDGDSHEHMRYGARDVQGRRRIPSHRGAAGGNFPRPTAGFFRRHSQSAVRRRHLTLGGYLPR